MHRVRARGLRSLVGAAAIALLTACTTTISGVGSTAGTTGAPHSAPARTSAAAGAGPSSSAGGSFTDCRSLFRLSVLTFPAGREQRLSFGCRTLDVPADYSRPHGPQLQLRVVRIHDSAGGRKLGSLLVNPGGPGASAFEFAVTLSARLPETVLQHYDLIGFDPRGVGLSSPIRCLTDTQQDHVLAASPNVLTHRGFTRAKQLATFVDSRCQKRYGPALPDLSTVATARDMDRVRQAVGDDRLNYLGFSYGTELGGVYAHLFPKRVRAMVLDGAVDPTTGDIQSYADQLQGFEKAFDQFAAYCRRTSPCSQLGDPRHAVQDVLTKASVHPIPTSTPGDGRRATTSLVHYGVLSALYSRASWPDLGRALQQALDGDSRGLLALSDNYNERAQGHYSNLAAANLAIGCNDSHRGPSDARIRATARSWTDRFPLFGLWSAATLFDCQQWQPDRSPVPTPTAPTSTPVLILGNLHDPATPYQGAKNLARVMGHARVLSWDGEGHTSYLQGSSCVDHHVDRYLTTLRLPPPRTTCPS